MTSPKDESLYSFNLTNLPGHVRREEGNPPGTPITTLPLLEGEAQTNGRELMEETLRVQGQALEEMNQKMEKMANSGNAFWLGLG